MFPSIVQYNRSTRGCESIGVHKRSNEEMVPVQFITMGALEWLYQYS